MEEGSERGIRRILRAPIGASQLAAGRRAARRGYGCRLEVDLHRDGRGVHAGSQRHWRLRSERHGRSNGRADRARPRREAAKGTAAVRAALELARANPRAEEEAAHGEGEESSDDGDENDEGNEALQGDDIYSVQARALEIECCI